MIWIDIATGRMTMVLKEFNTYYHKGDNCPGGPCAIFYSLDAQLLALDVEVHHFALSQSNVVCHPDSSA